MGEAASRAELLLRPLFPVLLAEGLPTLGEVELPEEPDHPNIDGKSIPAAVGVKQNTAGNFRTDAREFLQMPRGPFCGPGFRDLENLRLPGEDFGGGGEVFGTVTELAFPESRLPGAGEAARRGKIPAGSPESLAQALVDLADLDDLLEGGADEVGKALPRILTQGAQAGVGLAGLGKPRVLGGVRTEQGVELQLKAEVVLQGGGGKDGIVPDQLPVADGQGDGVPANPAGELARRGFIPAKGLPAKEGGGQIERNGELQGGHGGEKLKG